MSSISAVASSRSTYNSPPPNKVGSPEVYFFWNHIFTLLVVSFFFCVVSFVLSRVLLVRFEEFDVAKHMAHTAMRQASPPT
eukprot:NODE_2758_length_871_cov_47.006083_g2275_i0.p4 GENE.NODE_2758_length_871_cov_47.006083_g2275_i0~~NODE_2758_length_871_cov_47.006083_g2275_i0.p4  ORF type:complete len:81 (+),score=12.14 NODE_2758_length_871_cov_47.006083_g2275_i0:611-853(+)